MDVIGAIDFLDLAGIKSLLFRPVRLSYALFDSSRRSLFSLSLESTQAAVTPYFLSLLRGRRNPIHLETLDRNKSIPATFHSRRTRTTKPLRVESRIKKEIWTVESRYRQGESGEFSTTINLNMTLCRVFGKSWYVQPARKCFLMKRQLESTE